MGCINKVKPIYAIVTQTTCGYQRCGKTTGFIVRDIFAQSYLTLPVNHNSLHNYFAWTFYHFTCFPVLEGDIIRIANYDYDKYFSISTWGKPGEMIKCPSKIIMQ